MDQSRCGDISIPQYVRSDTLPPFCSGLTHFIHCSLILSFSLIMANAPVSRYHPGSLTARFRKMLEDDRSVESSGHEDSTTPCPEANGPIDTDRDRELSHQDRLENRHGQKIRRKERSVQSSSSRPYDQQQSASRQ